LASDPPFFKSGTTTACFIGAGNTVDSEVLMIRVTEEKERRSGVLLVMSAMGLVHTILWQMLVLFVSHPKVTQVQTSRVLTTVSQLAAEID